MKPESLSLLLNALIIIPPTLTSLDPNHLSLLQCNSQSQRHGELPVFKRWQSKPLIGLLGIFVIAYWPATPIANSSMCKCVCLVDE